MWLSKVLFVSEVLADDYEISFIKLYESFIKHICNRFEISFCNKLYM